MVRATGPLPYLGLACKTFVLQGPPLTVWIAPQQLLHIQGQLYTLPRKAIYLGDLPVQPDGRQEMIEELLGIR